MERQQVQPFKRPELEVADVFRQYGAEYLKTHPTGKQHRKVMGAIISCRSSSLGGHLDKCDFCGESKISYNSCRNRHCPKCQGVKQYNWLQNMRSVILPVPYFHVVFTTPHSLYPLVPYNEKVLYDLIFHSAAAALKESVMEGYGVIPGITGVLHTWGQMLNRHIHLHTIVTGGGLSADGSAWVSSSEEFLVDVKKLSILYKERYLAGLVKAYHKGELDLHYRHAVPLTDPSVFSDFIRCLKQEGWNSYSNPPFSGAESVLEYLSRYSHRVAIANSRIQSIADGKVTFDYKDYRDDDKHKSLTLTANGFIGSFLLHVLPQGYVKVRHFGIFVGRDRHKRIAKCRALLNYEIDEENINVESYIEMLVRLTGTDPRMCTYCKQGHMQYIMDIPPTGSYTNSRRFNGRDVA